MAETLFHAYTPLIVWMGLGLLLFRFMPQSLPRFLGRSLYWVGVPLQILALARRTDFSAQAGLAPVVTIFTLVIGLVVSWLTLQGLQRLAQPLATDQETGSLAGSPFPVRKSLASRWGERSFQGSFILAAILGNTGFVGLAIVPLLIQDTSLGWVIIYSVTHNIIGPFGIGVLVASYLGRSPEHNHWWIQLRDLFSVPALWALLIGWLSRSIDLPAPVETGLQASLEIVIPGAFLLIGMRLSQLQGWRSFQAALIPSCLRVVIVPGLIGLGVTLWGISGDTRLGLVLMSGMPTAFMGLILAEEYDLDRDLMASSIALTTIGLLLMIPVWLVIFGTPSIRWVI